MKNYYLTLYIIFFLSIGANAQERIQSIVKGISFIGSNKTTIENYLSSKSFYFNNKTVGGNMVEYTKDAPYGRHNFGIAIKNSKVSVVSWSEHLMYLQNVLSEIAELSFKSSSTNNAYKIYSFKNISRNLILTLFIKTDLNELNITIGKLLETKPVINVTPKVEVAKSKYDTGVEYNESEVEKYEGFEAQDNKVVWRIAKGFTSKPGFNFDLLTKTSLPIKAILAYYASISSISWDFSKALGFGNQCSPEQKLQLKKYFKNEQIVIQQTADCDSRAGDGEYLMNRLEYSEIEGIVKVSYALTYFKGNNSVGDIVGQDTFKINSDNTVEIIKLSPKIYLDK